MGAGRLTHAHSKSHYPDGQEVFPLSIAQAGRGVCDENHCAAIATVAEVASDVLYK